MAEWVLAGACLVFILISGRNDGAPLIALGLQARGSRGWTAALYLAVLIPLVPFVGFWGVAESLRDMMGVDGTTAAVSAALIGAVLITIGASNLANIPTSITLALVGALTGSAWAQGGTPPGSLLVRVLVLGVCAPFAAGLMAFLLSWLQLRFGFVTRGVVLMLRRLTLPALILSYAANDGQKALFVAALGLSMSVSHAASNPLVLLGATLVFMFGAWIGLRASGRFVRHGVAAIRSLDLLWVEASASLAVLGGAALGVPLSMTQSITGGVAGVGVSRSVLSVYWRNIGRIGLAWVWTLPASAALSWVLTRMVA